MVLARTNITIPSDLLDQIDDLVGPRGRSRYISEVLTRQVRRDRLKRVMSETAGAMVGKPGWMDPDESLAFARRLRAGWDDAGA